MKFNQLYTIASENFQSGFKYWKLRIIGYPTMPPGIDIKLGTYTLSAKVWYESLTENAFKPISDQTYVRFDTYASSKEGYAIYTRDLTLFDVFRFLVTKYSIEDLTSALTEVTDSEAPWEPLPDDVYQQLMDGWAAFIKNSKTNSIKSQGFENTDDLDAL